MSSLSPSPPPENIESAKSAGLRYVDDGQPGIRRQRVGPGFKYFHPNGKPLRDQTALKRIKSLAIPPAWIRVWICPDATGHLQATGYDDRRRKQYRYHARWRAARDETKYSRLVAFGQALPKIRRQVARHLCQPTLSRDNVLAALVRLLELGAVRIGNEQYVSENKSYGLTTLRNRHASVHGAKIHLHYRGKGGKERIIDVEHAQVARIVKRCQDLPGQRLFQFVDEAGARHQINSDDVNGYIAGIAGEDFTAKDFRTWTGTMVAASVLRSFASAHTQAVARKNITAAIEQAASRLGNTPAICKKCYVHPAILDCYLDGSLARACASLRPNGHSRRTLGLRPDEKAIVALLRRRLKETQPNGLLPKLSASLKRSS